MLTPLLVSVVLATGHVEPPARLGTPVPLDDAAAPRSTVRASAVELPALPQSAPAAAPTVHDFLPPPPSGQPAPKEHWLQDAVAPAATYGPNSSGKDQDQPPETPKEPPRRALPAVFNAPPFPTGEYQGYPLIGIPVDTTRYPLMKALQGTYPGDLLDSSRIRIYGWVNGSYNLSNAKQSNTPDSYWIVPNHPELDQFVFRAERLPDTVQTDHIDWGFRSTALFGIDYRYMTAGGWFSDQLLTHNALYGWDPTEQYFDLYYPWLAQGLILRVGRWIACPDIETQFAPDNYMGSHSLLFTFDTYTQTGVMATVMLNKQWMVQAAIHAGTDMAPWYQGATPTGMFGVRWVSEDDNDSIYFVYNSLNNAKFRYFFTHQQFAGHDNFNYPVITWQHRFSPEIFTKTEAYFMWQRDAPFGGTPSIGPVQPYGGGGGLGAPIGRDALTYGMVNYTAFQCSAKDFIVFRNEWWRDEDGERSGFAGTYTSHSVGWTHNFTDWLQIRPEVGYYRNWSQPAFDLGTKQGLFMAGFDVTLRF
jgi:hypothetical protein